MLDFEGWISIFSDPVCICLDHFRLKEGTCSGAYSHCFVVLGVPDRFSGVVVNDIYVPSRQLCADHFMLVVK